MSKVKSIYRKQPTLAAFGFKKTIANRGVKTEVKPPTEATEVLYPCDNCEQKLKSSLGLSFHTKTYQNVICNCVSSCHKKKKTGYESSSKLKM